MAGLSLAGLSLAGLSLAEMASHINGLNMAILCFRNDGGGYMLSGWKRNPICGDSRRELPAHGHLVLKWLEKISVHRSHSREGQPYSVINAGIDVSIPGFGLVDWLIFRAVQF